MNTVTKFLNEQIVGNVFEGSDVLEAYSRDSSALKVKPLLVATPVSTGDIQVLVKNVRDFAKRGYKIPIAVRGSGLSKTGADLSGGMVISLEKLNRVMEIDETSRLDSSHLVRVQSGVTLGQLKTTLAARNLTIPIDADPHETISDLITTCVSDGLSGKYHGIMHYTEQIEVVLGTGDIIQTGPCSVRAMLKRATGSKSFQDKFLKQVHELLAQYFDIIEDVAKSPRDFAGYSMISMVEDSRQRMDLKPLFFGSDNTLGIITEVILRAVPILRESQSMLVEFSDIYRAAPFIHTLRKEKPARATIFDANIVRVAAEQGKHPEILEQIEKGYYIKVDFDDSKATNFRKIKISEAAAAHAESVVVQNAKNKSDFEQLSQIIQYFLNSRATSVLPAVADDVFVPLPNLPEFLAGLTVFKENYKREIPVIGSVTTDLYSVRPVFDLSTLDDRKAFLGFLRNYASYVRKHNGSLTGGASEGRIKGSVIEHAPRYKKLFTEVKNLFDPDGILNPDAKIGADFAKVAKSLTC